MLFEIYLWGQIPPSPPSEGGDWMLFEIIGEEAIILASKGRSPFTTFSQGRAIAFWGWEGDRFFGDGGVIAFWGEKGDRLLFKLQRSSDLEVLNLLLRNSQGSWRSLLEHWRSLLHKFSRKCKAASPV